MNKPIEALADAIGQPHIGLKTLARLLECSPTDITEGDPHQLEKLWQKAKKLSKGKKGKRP